MPVLKPARAIQLNKSHPLARGLVGCWLFNEGSGGKVFDLSGNGNNGTLQADTHFVPGKYGSCLDFDGTGDYVDCGAGSSLDIPGDVTVSMWTNIATLNGYQGFLSAGRPLAKREQYALWVWGNTVRYVSGDGTNYEYVSMSPVPPTGSFIQIAFTRSGTFVQMYINGATRGSGSLTYTPVADPYDTWLIGSLNPGANFFTGTIDHVMIFNRALTAGEIQQLYREPFCMFAVPIEPGLLYPAGQIVLLAAASMAAASAYGSLTKQSRLAGRIDTAAALSGILKLRYRGQVERQWLVEALFNGMTANAFKLGTVLTGGWFWMRWSGCSVLYRGPSMQKIDFTNILAVAEQDAGSISPPDYIPHNSNTTYFYIVRRFNNYGYQERTLTVAVKVSIDTDGNLAKLKPNNIVAWSLDQVHSNKIHLIWFYCGLEQESKPESFRIYYDGGTGLVDYENPIATINYQGRMFYTYQSDALIEGRYLVAVRAENADGVEDNSLAQLGIQLDTTNPDAIDILSVETL